jgi:hypothetical protein
MYHDGRPLQHSGVHERVMLVRQVTTLSAPTNTTEMLGDGHGMPNRGADGRPLAAADVERFTLVRQVTSRTQRTNDHNGNA